MESEQIVYSSLLTLAGAVLADPEPMLARMVRGCIALAFTAGVRAVASSHRLAEPVKGQRAQLHYTGVAARANCVQIAADAALGGPGRS